MFLEDLDTEERQDDRKGAYSVFPELREIVVNLTLLLTIWLFGVIILGLCVLALWILGQAVADVLRSIG